ncbi:ABC transporter permease [Streptomyces xiaopingdaonensis]|uniref:ABC transporter permease n=1 Tax=Streptomyces xiaopingdaonensis TaxID=1565415 RepID=UPI00031D6D1F|nr:ABC transporter permease [Streptomyces xiaopingdaonensis]
MSELAPRRGGLLADTAALTARSTRISTRNPDAVLVSLLMPVLLMVVFVHLFGGAIDTGTEYVAYVTPAVLVLCAGYGASMTAQSVTFDMAQGVVDRFRSMDVGAVPFLGGHVAASAARNAVAVLAVVGAAALMGFRAAGSPLGWLAAAGLLLAWIVALSWLAACVGLVAKSPEGAGGFGFFLLFLPYPSSGFVPIETMPGWLRGFAEHQPATPLIESVRALLLGEPAGGAVWRTLAWCFGILVCSVALSGVVFRRRSR